jgi:ORF6N domain
VFQLTAKEDGALRSQFVISKEGRGGRRYPPYAFTEHGAIMAATVLNSTRAVEMSELDRRLETHDTAIQDIIDAKELMVPEEPSKRKIGFQLPPGKR